MAEREARSLSGPAWGGRPSATPEPLAAESGQPPAFDAVVLAGGRASRLGGADKPGLLVGTQTMLASVVAAADSAGAQRIVAVGPARPDLADWLTFVREEPPGSGPVPALRRGLAEVSAPMALVLAADLPFLRARHLRILLGALLAEPALVAEPAGGPAVTSGVIMVDDMGLPQWLAGCWRTAVLRAAIGKYAGRSLRGLLSPLEPTLLDPALLDSAPLGRGQAAAEPPPWLDCDTPDDLTRARAWQGEMQHRGIQQGASRHQDIGPGETRQERETRR